MMKLLHALPPEFHAAVAIRVKRDDDDSSAEGDNSDVATPAPTSVPAAAPPSASTNHEPTAAATAGAPTNGSGAAAGAGGGGAVADASDGDDVVHKAVLKLPSAVTSHAAMPPLLIVAAYLDPTSLCRTACTSRAAARAFTVDSVWKGRAVELWPELQHRSDDKDWKDCYQRKHREGGTSFQDLTKDSELGRCAWYQCRQGHLYAIGECRLPIFMAFCPTCGERIGGGDHTMASDNRRWREQRLLQRIGSESLSRLDASVTASAAQERQDLFDAVPLMREGEAVRVHSAYRGVGRGRGLPAAASGAAAAPRTFGFGMGAPRFGGYGGFGVPASGGAAYADDDDGYDDDGDLGGTGSAVDRGAPLYPGVGYGTLPDDDGDGDGDSDGSDGVLPGTGGAPLNDLLMVRGLPPLPSASDDDGDDDVGGGGGGAAPMP